MTHKMTQEVSARGIICDMVIGNFKGHGADRGRRLLDQQGLGDSNWARRFATVEETSASPPAVRLERARAAVSKVEVKAGPRGRGRPRIAGDRPWDVDGVSRKTWERRKAKGLV
jgi:hypothetical protein